MTLVVWVTCILNAEGYCLISPSGAHALEEMLDILLEDRLLDILWRPHNGGGRKNTRVSGAAGLESGRVSQWPQCHHPTAKTSSEVGHG